MYLVLFICLYIFEGSLTSFSKIIYTSYLFFKELLRFTHDPTLQKFG